MFCRHPVDRTAGRRILDRVAHPATEDPSAIGKEFRITSDAFDDLFTSLHVAKLHRRERVADPHEVNMRIVEARQDELAAGVYNVGLGTS